MANTKKALAEASKFFERHAGSSYDPKKETEAQGKKRGAKRLAEAEAYAASMGWKFKWDHDPDPDLSWASEEDKEAIEEVLYCVLKDQNGNVLASLSGITFGRNNVDNRNYGRVVEAELALEAMPS